MKTSVFAFLKVLVLIYLPWYYSNMSRGSPGTAHRTTVGRSTGAVARDEGVGVYIPGVAKVKTSDIPGAWSLCRTRRGRMAAVSVSCGATCS
eukprot:COSAG02_NODE_88_length_38629_cov_457.967999_18_plen_92_part_00